MDNASTRLQYKVGLFLALGLIALMASILVLGGNRVLFASYIHLKTSFNQVQGLFPGSVVSLAGLPVGNVTKIEFAPGTNRLEVTMQIDEKFQERLHEGMTAEIRTQGALGDKYVYLEPGPSDKPLLRDGAYVQPIEDGDIFKILTSKEDGVGRFLDLVKEMHILVASLNKNNRVGNTAQNISDLTTQMKSTLGRVDILLGNLNSQMPEDKKIRHAAASLASVLEKIDKGQGTLGALVNDPSLHQSLKSFLGTSPRNRYMRDMVRETIQQNEAAK